MADFCNQCAKELGLPLGDHKGATDALHWAQGMAAVVMCEGCGPIQVDPKGNCISDDCSARRYPGEGHTLHPTRDGAYVHRTRSWRFCTKVLGIDQTVSLMGQLRSRYTFRGAMAKLTLITRKHLREGTL